MPAWDSNVLAGYRFENNANDDQGSFNGTKTGANIIYDNTIYHDDAYAIRVTNYTGSYIEAPAGLQTALKNSSAGWTLEFWWRNNGGNQVSVLFQALTGVGSGVFDIIPVPGSGVRIKYCDLIVGDYYIPWVGTTIAWRHIAITYDRANSRLKIYSNNSLLATYNSIADAFGTTGAAFHIGGNSVYGGAAEDISIDNFVVSNYPRTTFPTVRTSTPTITDVSPASGTTAGGTSVTLTGTEFASGASVTFGGDAATSVVVGSATSITCDTPAHAAGLVDVTVTNTDGGTYTLTNGYEYMTPAPIITSITPSEGITLGGESVMIAVSNLQTGFTITFDGMPIDYTEVSPGVLEIITPTHASGIVSIVITNPDSQYATGVFTYVDLVIKRPQPPYRVYLNGIDLTDEQPSWFFQRLEMQILSRYDLSYSQTDLVVPDDMKECFRTGSFRDVVTVRDSIDGFIVYQGFIQSREHSESKKQYKVSSVSFLSLLSKEEAVLSTSTRSPLNLFIAILKPYMSTTLRNMYRITEQAEGFANLFKDLNIFVNTETNTANIMIILISLLEICDVGLYYYEDELEFAPFGRWGQLGEDVKGEELEPPDIRERRDLVYDTITISYYTAVGAAESTVTVGPGNTVKKFSWSNIYMDTITALKIAKRKQKLYSQIYYETTLRLDRNMLFQVGQFMQYDGYNFLITSRQEKLSENVYKLLGIKLGG